MKDSDAPLWGWKFDNWIANRQWGVWEFLHKWLCRGCIRERRRERRRTREEGR